MKIISVVFSLLMAFIITISMMTSNLKDRRDNVKTKIEKWQIHNGNLYLKLTLKPNEQLFFSKELNCLTYDKEKNKISSLDKKIELNLKDRKTIVVNMGKSSKKVKFIDCNFIKD